MLLIGIVIGLLIGVLPGLTLVMGVALALPFTYKMDVTASIVLLDGDVRLRHLWRRLYRHFVPDSR